MPLVANSDLPAFKRLEIEGETIIPGDTALHQDIRELHIGLLNMMPDAALTATERQFFRLVGESNQIAQFYTTLRAGDLLLSRNLPIAVSSVSASSAARALPNVAPTCSSEADSAENSPSESQRR